MTRVYPKSPEKQEQSVWSPPLGPSPTLALMMVQCRELFSWS